MIPWNCRVKFGTEKLEPLRYQNVKTTCMFHVFSCLDSEKAWNRWLHRLNALIMGVTSTKYARHCRNMQTRPYL